MKILWNKNANLILKVSCFRSLWAPFMKLLARLKIERRGLVVEICHLDSSLGRKTKTINGYFVNVIVLLWLYKNLLCFLEVARLLTNKLKYLRKQIGSSEK